VIWVTRLDGIEIVVNSDLVESIEATPDTILTLIDGNRYLVQESAADVVERIRRYRVSILTLLDSSAVEPPAEATPAPAVNLYVLPSDNRS
jgi:flagellar protein FlbD